MESICSMCVSCTVSVQQSEYNTKEWFVFYLKNVSLLNLFNSIVFRRFDCVKE